MKPESNALERAVRSVLFTGAITAFAVSPMAMAQEEGDEDEDQLELGRQVVTGSRIKRIDLEEARPVVVITREEIELSGQESVADVLRNSPINTFGSSREVSGNSFVGQATIDLHGIGSTRSLVLLDGRRAPRSPVTANQANDLNIIPLSAVDRIEILTDSASAIYGSDAIGGVINVILRKDYDGLEVGTSLQRPTREGADSDAGVITIGGSTNRGRFLFTADFRNKGHIAAADRFYTKGDSGYDAGTISFPYSIGNRVFEEPPFEATWYAWENTNNVSGWGNTVWSPRVAAPNCEQVVDQDGERLLLGPYLAANGQTYCGFDYTAFSWETADLKRTSAFLHADYELNPDHAVRLQSMFSTVNNHGRYAPAVGFFLVPPAAAEGLKQAFDFDVPYPEALPYGLVHRFVGLGNRDFMSTNTLFENAVLAYGTVGMFDYEFEARHTRYDGREDSCCYAKRFTTSQYVSQGLYNPFDPLSADNASAYDAITANANRDIRADFRTYSGNVSFDFLNAPGGPIGWAVGFDYIDEQFYDIYDPLSAGGDLIGSAGNSGEGERVVKAGFAEVLVPLWNSLEVSAAGRYDSYDDSAGNETSLYLSARYQPTDWLLFRASWGEGFRAANMNNLYGARSVSFEGGTDLVECQRAGIAPEFCVEQQYPTFTGGNPLLAPELSDSYNIGAVVDWEPFSARVDFWNLNLEDGIGLGSLQNLIETELLGGCRATGEIVNTINTGTRAEIIECSPGNVLKRDPDTGLLLEAEAGWGNTFKQEIGGLDVQLRYDLETATAGDFTFGIFGARLLRYRSLTRTATEWNNTLGEGLGDGARPKYQAQVLVRWNYTDHTVSAYARHIAGYIRPDAGFEAPSHTEYDLIYRWTTPWDGRVTIGVLNVTDEDPELDSFASPRPAVYDLYSLDGRVPYVSYRHFF
ncbi:MAG: TonB-dependent receptor [Gammaproteobacteria bacterium]|nr:TonB-dependent receptor [Gammaproteobacteria bacterium]MYF67844.1 TonB-dependent receptor [Gammaproteobacteria bacterium]MYK37873.1 TonB-dependent receptor [Gammaproteobacteria bacterium]